MTPVFSDVFTEISVLLLVAALYVAVALTFSSTIIIVKLWSDKREMDSLHGRIAIGFLIVQDIVVVLVMIGRTGVGDTRHTGGAGFCTFALCAYWQSFDRADYSGGYGLS